MGILKMCSCSAKLTACLSLQSSELWIVILKMSLCSVELKTCRSWCLRRPLHQLRGHFKQLPSGRSGLANSRCVPDWLATLDLSLVWMARRLGMRFGHCLQRVNNFDGNFLCREDVPVTVFFLCVKVHSMDGAWLQCCYTIQNHQGETWALSFGARLCHPSQRGVSLQFAIPQFRTFVTM